MICHVHFIAFPLQMYLLKHLCMYIFETTAVNVHEGNCNGDKHLPISCCAMKTKGMVFRYTWVYSKEDTMAHTRRPVVTS